MKKTLVVFLLIPLITACSNTDQSPQEDEENSKIQEILSNELKECEGKTDQIQKDDCYLNYAVDKTYWVDNVSSNESNLCRAITQNSWRRAQCFWLFAMKTKDLNLCSNLPGLPQEIMIDLKGDDPNYGYALSIKFNANKENCMNQISYKNTDAEWNLSSGLPPYADPFPLIYTGNAKISGWIVSKPSFGEGEPMSYFHVIDTDMNKLPLSARYYSDFLIESSLADITSQLEKYSESNPAKININKIGIPFEGSPFMNLVEIVE